MNTHVASRADAANDRVTPIATALDPLAESARMLGLAVLGSAAVVSIMWLVF